MIVWNEEDILLKHLSVNTNVNIICKYVVVTSWIIIIFQYGPKGYGFAGGAGTGLSSDSDKASEFEYDNPTNIMNYNRT